MGLNNSRIRVLFVLLVCFSVFSLFRFSLYPQSKIKEYVSVNWWILPFYAVSNGGEGVKPLGSGDIRLFINGEEIKDFTLLRDIKIGDKDEISGTPKKIVKANKKEKEKLKHVTFLLFDNMLTDPLIFMKCKSIAKKIIDEASEGTDFILLTLDGYSGIKYYYGPGSDKKKIKKVLRRKIVPRKKRAHFGFGSGIDYNDVSYYHNEPQENIDLANTWDNLEKKKWIIAKHAMKNYLSSLVSLKYILKFAMKKSLFFFSSGIKKKLLFKGRHQRMVDALPYWMLKNTAKEINKSGTLFFIVNPEGTRRLSSDLESGEDTLISLAGISGGKYLEGTKDEIAKSVNRIARSYYTVSFPERENFKGDSIKIKLVSKRKDVKIYSPRVLSRDKNYGNMNRFEREMLVVDIVSGGFWSKTRIGIKKIKLKEIGVTATFLKYKWKDCELSKGRYADIFIVHTKNGKKEIKLEKDRRRFSRVDFLIKVKKLKGYKTDIIIIDQFKNTAYFSPI